MVVTSETSTNIIYPDSDGQPMADNTKQFQWIVTIKENLEILFASQPDVFVAGDLLWYPVLGETTRQAPDVLVVFGRPKGDRGSYKQWLEENIPVQVVFEILSPGNTLKEMAKKLSFYERYGVEEYYIYDSDKNDLNGWLRTQESGQNRLEVIEEINTWVSPRLGIRFHLTPQTLEIYRPDGEKFLTSVELAQQREQERQRAEIERQRADNAETQLFEERQRYQDLLKKLQEKGIDPEQL
ncbi:Uma2 family endonuclease [Plectonema cf. radiosum LEGE 06105]|uniref:Uma2 family endonuclease n=1 Tax=Plectonema cf. radiosum LEGE 06105 TaxID=945769 RepID=A0A8J7FD80_9CYAN|nr:Uma2 family endonuclease [Plectonema radiosum]MBE9214163.1 Uma2 family endonuclease [Plectonema cf. radiosum LEGE 06105]